MVFAKEGEGQIFIWGYQTGESHFTTPEKTWRGKQKQNKENNSTERRVNNKGTKKITMNGR